MENDALSIENKSFYYFLKYKQKIGSFVTIVKAMAMIYLTPQSTDVYFNLAAEEHLLKNFSDDIFMLWENEPAVVVGKFQNMLAEVNQDYAKQHRIKLARRFTGGGAVYQDNGNLNFTFIENSGLADFNRFATRMTQYLQKIGINAETDDRNALLINGFKISGSAQCIHKNRVLYHGTLLFTTKLGILNKVLHNKDVKYKDKAVQSVRSRVANLYEHCTLLTMDTFKTAILKAFLEENPHAKAYQYNKRDKDAIINLRNTKYATWDWIYGRSPSYAFSKQIYTSNGVVESHVEVTDGRIVSIGFSGNDKYLPQYLNAAKLLQGYRHDLKTLKHCLSETNLEEVKAQEILSIII